MKAYVAITDRDWFSYLFAQPGIDEVNFWQPSGEIPFHAIQPGELFLFKLRHRWRSIVGGGILSHTTTLPLSLAWEAFGTKNGVASFAEMRQRVGRLRHVTPSPTEDYTIGCILLGRPFFLEQSEWIDPPSDWRPQIVRGKTYDLSQEEGKRIWRDLLLRRPLVITDGASREIPVVAERYGEPTIVRPRLGQGTFRVLVTDLYERRCSVTGERTLPVLQAAHIKPYAHEGPHEPQNGLLLRSDIHTLFDRGYVTVTPQHRFEVSRRIKDEFENGRDYYALQGRTIRMPTDGHATPSPEFLDWHGSNVFRG